MENAVHDLTGLEIAIIGMAGRFPGANSIGAFWSNLCNGVESISHFSATELARNQIPPSLLRDKHYVKSSAIIDDVDMFDATFFGYTPREAATMDPQHRIFLECAWEALESAGYDPHRYSGAIGVFAGAGRNTYLPPGSTFDSAAEEYQASINNINDFLATRVSYKLNLTGPSITVQSACSTSLVAVHLACQSLISGDCDIALAGGVSLRFPHQSGYLYQPGGIMAPDGHCRPFDAAAQGTVIGNGAGIVVLKRLVDALDDGDTIHAIIKGSAINNDGSMKMGYTAPSEEGQIRVIRAAQNIAEVLPDSITYVEAHGTGTALGDPIEVAALTKAFRVHTQRRGFCALGSLKSNIGHLDTAAGVAGLIKTVLALKQRKIPPTLHFTQPNPKLQLENSPFYVNNKLVPWPEGPTPRRAAVSALGVGGTNAHVILEEAPPAEPSFDTQPWQLLVLSAKTPTALEHMSDRLAAHLRRHQHVSLADIAYTLQVGRQMFKYRRMLICNSPLDAANALANADPKRIMSGVADITDPRAVFLFPGQGSQYVQMAAGLYETQHVFREQIDRCAEILKSHLGIDLRDVLYPDLSRITHRGLRITDSHGAILDLQNTYPDLDQTWIAQPALFMIEYALARLWMSWGVRPWAMIGHSLGEYVAACIAGVFSLEDALAVIVTRGRLMQKQPAGAMLAVPLSEEELRPLLDSQIDIAAINAPSMCVVSGPHAAINALRTRLAEQEVECRLLHTSHAFHSAAMDPVLTPFTNFLQTIKLNPPQLPFISNVTGTWITASEATDPHYWAQHIRQAVRFSAGIQTLLEAQNQIFLEIGPGRTLSTFVRQQPKRPNQVISLASLRHPNEQISDFAFILRALGQLWLHGVSIDWQQLSKYEVRHRVRLPTYPFERQRHWIETRPANTAQPLQIETSHHTRLAYQARQDASTESKQLNPLEQTIRSVWQEVLGIPTIGLHDNFFDLGGDSLTAIHLLSKLGQVLGSTLPSHSLLQTPTIAELAAAVAPLVQPADESHNEPRSQPHTIVELQAGQPHRQPLFLVHPIGGGVYGYRDLAQALGADQPVYGLQAHDQEQPITDVSQIATHYVEAILQVRPHGPYHIGGFSFGGVVAFEIAQQLQARQEEVSLLTLIDTPWPGDIPNDIDGERAIIDLALNADPTISAHIDRIWQQDSQQRLASCLAYAKQLERFPAHFELADFERLVQMLYNHLQALRSYQPQPYHGPMIYFSAQERGPQDPAHPELEWVPRALHGISIIRANGNHMSMIHPPYVAKLGQQLRLALENHEPHHGITLEAASSKELIKPTSALLVNPKHAPNSSRFTHRRWGSSGRSFTGSRPRKR